MAISKDKQIPTAGGVCSPVYGQECPQGNKKGEKTLPAFAAF
jgi:hypothetical protein